MTDFYFYGLLVFSFLCCLMVLRLVLSQYRSNKALALKNSELNERLNKDLEESLILATSDQLLKELRCRHGAPYILLMPIKEKDFNGIIIESHSINQASCFAMLHLAKAITAQNFRNNGLQPPKLPPISDYFS